MLHIASTRLMRTPSGTEVHLYCASHGVAHLCVMEPAGWEHGSEGPVDEPRGERVILLHAPVPLYEAASAREQKE